jgi:hypothetical protein
MQLRIVDSEAMYGKGHVVLSYSITLHVVRDVIHAAALKDVMRG